MTMRKTAGFAASLFLFCQSGAALGAVPEFGTREGELACVGLVQLGFMAAQASKPSYQQVVIATAIGLGFYAGRVSKIDPKATKDDIDRALSGLTLEEKNTYANTCIKKAAALSGPQFTSEAGKRQ